jgi:hypothetical protein
MKGCWVLSNVLLNMLNNHVIFVNCVYVLYSIYCFYILNHPSISGIKPTWSWYVIFLMCCWIWYFTKAFCIYVHQGHWSIDFFLLLLLGPYPVLASRSFWFHTMSVESFLFFLFYGIHLVLGFSFFRDFLLLCSISLLVIDLCRLPIFCSSFLAENIV